VAGNKRNRSRDLAYLKKIPVVQKREYGGRVYLESPLPPPPRRIFKLDLI
jgi:hypothetical protein